MVNRRYILTLFAVGLVVALLAPVLIIPQGLERSVVLKSDGYQDAAHTLMKKLYVRGDRSEALVHAFVQQKLDLGQIEAAETVLAEYSADQPDLTWPRTQMLDIRDTFGSEEERINAVLAAYGDTSKNRSMHGLAEHLRNTKTLMEHYRITGNYAREAEIIEDSAAAGFASVNDIYRLGVIKASTGQVDDAIEILQGIDDRLPKQAVSERLTLYSMLISNGRPLDAVDYAQKWQDNWDDPWIGYELQEIMQAFGYSDIANRIDVDDAVYPQP